MTPEILASEPIAKPRRRGRPRAAEAEVVREWAGVILENGVSVARIAKQFGVHRRTVYRWLQLAESA